MQTRGTTILAVLIAAGIGVGLFALAPKGGKGGAPRKAPAGSKPPIDSLRSLRAVAAKLRPLHRPMPPPQAGDWRLGPGSDEKGQSFDQWLRCRPVKAEGKRRTIYVQAIGDLGAQQREIVSLTSEFLGIYFGLPVKSLKDVPVDDKWPKHARRVHPQWGGKQILSTYVLHDRLAPTLPADAAVLIGLTAWDLWPGRGWNFVFGQASLRKRVGVWSIHRFGDPKAGRKAWLRCLLRTIKVATRETGHMFSLEHCTAYDCNMCGSNHLEETDRHRLALCPDCLPKVCVATGVKPPVRFEKLAAFCRKHGLKEDAAFYGKCVEAIKAP